MKNNDRFHAVEADAQWFAAWHKSDKPERLRKRLQQSLERIENSGINLARVFTGEVNNNDMGQPGSAYP